MNHWSWETETTGALTKYLPSGLSGPAVALELPGFLSCPALLALPSRGPPALGFQAHSTYLPIRLFPVWSPQQCPMFCLAMDSNQVTTDREGQPGGLNSLGAAFNP